MPKQIQLTIAEPCHENWDSMTPLEKGRFCNSCQKPVIDFTGMNDAQLAAFFKKPSTGSVCGRFMTAQLDNTILMPKKRIPWLKYFLQLTVPLFLTSLKSTAQGLVIVRSLKSETVHEPVKKVECSSMSGLKKVRGTVVNEENKPVPFASIMIKGTKSGVAADEEGVFNIELPAETMGGTLVVSSVGFESKEFPLGEKDIAGTKNPVIQLTTFSMGDVMLTTPVLMVGAVSVITYTDHTIETITPEDNQLPVFGIYPNPAVAGSSINIECRKLEENYYSFQLLTVSGQLLLKKEIWIDKAAGLLNMPVPAVKPGTYFLRMVNKKSGKIFTEKLVIR
jgi:hypothetical protein